MKKLLFILLLNSIFISQIYASNYSFLNYSPVFYFTDQDWQIMDSTLKNVLNNGRTNAKVEWRNPATGAHGYFIPVSSSGKKGKNCRYINIFNEAKNVTGQATYQFCKINGNWKVMN